ncbi:MULTISPECIES: N-acetyltransferase DgcN [Thalassotalea]|uniref:N-acetyltransferase DgcN n=1 Tax=Thalassotalea TaxID=1518149 RepID=UPI00094251F2|nr:MULTISPECIES: N-acetyltransferase DgcN [Thalassotalea]OKY26220.1 EBNA-1 nuclear protein [Thalassotalea sp. PP2-459]
MQIIAPYLLFIGDATDELSIKMARGAADWRPELCIGEMSVDGCTVTTGLNETTIEEAATKGAKTFVLGFANSGGVLAPKWHQYIIKALELGMDVVSGLHDKLTDVPKLVAVANKHNQQLFDIRHPKANFKTGSGVKRTGKRLLTVGTDCSVGKMYTSLSLEKSMKSQGVSVDFRATGQCGILIAGQGLAIDCIVSDFISGATETLSPNNQADHWDIIEGQGSLSHPAFAGVSIGLLHGSQPDALVICHALNRTHMRGLPHTDFPSIAETIELNLTAAKLTNPNVKVVGIAVNTSSVSIEEGKAYCKRLSEEFSLPCVDPVRDGTDAIVNPLIHLQQA